MYVRTTARRNKDGSVVRYLQLAHNVWDAERGQARAQVIAALGREDELDRDGLARLVRSISRFLAPAPELAALPQLRFLGARPWGASSVLDSLWGRLGISEALDRVLPGHRLAPAAERVIFSLAARLVLGPGSTVPGGPGDLLGDRVPGRAPVDAVDFLVEAEEGIQREVLSSLAARLGLEVEAVAVGTGPVSLRADAGDDLGGWGRQGDEGAQGVVALAVAPGGIPVRCWAFPAWPADLVGRLHDELAAWRLGGVLWAGGGGLAPGRLESGLQRCGSHRLIGERLTEDGAGALALAHPGRYRVVGDDLEVREVWVGEGSARRRLVVYRHRREAERDRARRDRAATRLEAELEAVAARDGEPRARGEAELLTHPGLGPYLTRRRGRLVLDRARLRADERLDGTFLVSSSDSSLPAATLAGLHRGLADVERVWGDLHHGTIPCSTHLSGEERLRASATLGFLALVLVRAAERACGLSWRELAPELDRIQLGEFADSAGRVVRRTEITPAQRRLLRALGVDEPPPVELPARRRRPPDAGGSAALD